ncbi:hypothetical protein R1sor_008057 [Riccia sorocarpa]|uniref:Uncharacterized protein n=1 Tax=Riccia sorocarpa TaxID=122646 RepID=A0ABD3HWF8_9MARC
MSNPTPVLETPLVAPPQEGEIESLLAQGVTTRDAYESIKMKPWGSFVNNVYDAASNLANLLPTGTYLAFTTIAPIVTDNGTCDQPEEFWMSVATTAFFAIFCFLSSFTDSYQAADGQVYYGIVTFKGLWTPQLPEVLHPGDKEEYKLTFVDVIHAVLSVAVFAACSLMTPNIKACFYPSLRDDPSRTIPAFVAFVVSSVFTAFPSKRHGIGFPVSPATTFFFRGAPPVRTLEISSDSCRTIQVSGGGEVEEQESRIEKG